LENTDRPTTIDDLTLIRTPSDPQISPDGSRIAYTLKCVDVEKNRYQTHIHVVATAADGGPARQWTQGPDSEDHPRWSPDGRCLAFLSGREDKKGQIFLLPLEGGEAEKATSLPEGAIADFVWSPDSTKIAFLFRPNDAERGEEATDARKKAHLSSPPREITRRQYRADGSGFVPKAPFDLHVLDLASRAVSQITHGEHGDQGSFCWSPDSARLAVVRNTAPDPDLMPNATEIFLLPATGLGEGELGEKVAAPLGPKDEIAWSPDGREIAFLGHDDPEEVWGVKNAHVWVAPAVPDAPAARDLTPDWDVTGGNAALGDVAGAGRSGPFWVPDGGSVLVQASERGSVQIYRLSLDPTIAPVALTTGAHAITGFTADAKSESLALLIATTADAGDLYCMTIGSAFFRRITRTNGDLFDRLDLPSPIAFEATAPDGQAVPCWAMLPPDWRDDPTPRPSILYIHGGPHLMYANTLFHEYQALAAAGYVVIYPNPRGSSGYGEAWTGAIRGNWGAPAQADALACVDYAVEQGWADPDRLGVAGGSYGGFLTAWIVGHSDRFRAAVAERGVFNLHSMAGTCDFVWRDHDYFDADMTGDPADYLRNSPLTYADAIHTPLLIVHSEGDLRCPIEQAEQLFAALKLRGRDVVFLRYGPEASHGLSRGGPPDLRQDRQRRITAFFDKYLRA
jgi:dipeptidyl aminopeptidase/acylaminoacyl peptidase